MPPPLCGQTMICPTKAVCMLSQLPHFCNTLLALPLPAWQGAWAAARRRGRPHRVAVVWRTLDLTSPTHRPRSLQGGRTPIHLSTTTPPVPRMDACTKHAAACLWQTARALSIWHHDASTPRQQPHALARGAACLSLPDGSAAMIPAYRSRVRVVWRVRQKKGGFGETPQGIWGDAPGDLGRRPRGFGETKNETTP